MHILSILLLILSAPSTQPPTKVRVSTSIAFPPELTSAEMHWGIKRGPVRLAAGHVRVVRDLSEPVDLLLAATPEPWVDAVPDGPATLYLCINHDTLQSHIPSFGDRHQRIPIRLIDGRAQVTVPVTGWATRRLSKPENVLTVHYHRFEGDYESVGLWTWDEKRKRTPEENEIFAVGRDGYGLVFQLDIGDYGWPGDSIGLLPRMRGDWGTKDGGDRYWHPRMPREIYLLQGSDDVCTSRPDTTPRLVGATLDGFQELTLRFTHLLSPEAVQPIVVRNNDGKSIETHDVQPVAPEDDGRSRAFRVRTKAPVELAGMRYQVQASDFEPRSLLLGRVLAHPRFHDPDAQLGALVTARRTTFGVFAPTAKTVEVIIAEAVTGGSTTAHPMTRNENGVWSAVIEDDVRGQFYAYRLSGPGLDPEAEVADIYASCAQGLRGRPMLVDLDATDPPGFDPSAYVPLASPVDAVIYELHVRDLSMSANSGIEHKGRYLGLTETGTTLAGAPSFSTGLDHLVELGVTHVHLLPVQDYENNEAQDRFNWGYMTVFFNTPEGLYASTPTGDARIRELKQVVQAFHERGIGVVLDVVYNHTSPYATFENTVPGYYHRRRPDGTFWNGSGCGNEVQTEYPMTRKFIVDSLVFWVREYGIDGFRFDLMGLMDLETMEAIREALRDINPSVLLYGEPWAAGPSGLSRITDKGVIAGSGIAAFNDNYRDAIKGDRDGGAPGFIQAGDRIDGVRSGVAAAVGTWATAPSDVVTYCAAHDNLTLWDKLLQSVPAASEAVKQRMQRFAGLLVLTSQGIPFLHAGQEMCRTKGGNHNSYDAPDSVNAIDWSWKQRHHSVFAYYKGLIALRKSHPVFRLRTREQVEQRLSFVTEVPSSRCVAYELDGAGLAGESFARVLVLLNGDETPRSFKLPDGKWVVYADADRAATVPLRTLSGEVAVPAHAGAVLARTKP